MGDAMKNRLHLIGFFCLFATCLLFPALIGSASGTVPPVEIRWQHEVTPDASYLVNQTIPFGPQVVPSHLVFRAKEDLPGFQLLDMEMMHWDDAANMGVFWVKKIFSLRTLTPAHPLPVTVAFYGDLPNVGFSYLTAEGERRCFAVGLSGKDGSLYAQEVRCDHVPLRDVTGAGDGYGRVVGESEPLEGAPLYGALLDGFYDILCGGDSAFVEDCGGAVGVREVVSLLGSRAALYQVGYAIQDITGDGVPELLVGLIKDGDGAASFGTTILAVYTSPGARPVCVLEGWARNHFLLMDGGRFLREGANGAMSSSFGEYTLSADGRQLSCTSFYFTAESPLDSGEIEVYYNTAGTFDPSQSEKLDMPLDAFLRMQTELAGEVRQVNLMPFGFEMGPR